MSKTQTSTGLRVRMKIGGWRKGLSRYGGEVDCGLGVVGMPAR